MDKGSPSLVASREALAATQVEQVGKRLRALSQQEVQEARGVG
jgi:ketol-acid reductoisomerase